LFLLISLFRFLLCSAKIPDSSQLDELVSHVAALQGLFRYALCLHFSFFNPLTFAIPVQAKRNLSLLNIRMTCGLRGMKLLD
jgi:hypothetical protein